MIQSTSTSAILSPFIPVILSTPWDSMATSSPLWETTQPPASPWHSLRLPSHEPTFVPRPSKRFAEHPALVPLLPSYVKDRTCLRLRTPMLCRCALSCSSPWMPSPTRRKRNNVVLKPASPALVVNCLVSPKALLCSD